MSIYRSITQAIGDTVRSIVSLWFVLSRVVASLYRSCSGFYKEKSMFKQAVASALVVGLLAGCTTVPKQPLPASAYKTWAEQSYGLESCSFTGRLSTELAAYGKTLLSQRVANARKSYEVENVLIVKEYQVKKQQGQRIADGWCLETALAITQVRQEAAAKEREAARAAAAAPVIVRPITTNCNTVLGWTHCM